MAYNNLGSTYFSMGEHNKALTALKKAITLKADYGRAHYNLSVVFFNEGNYALAIMHCDRAQELGIQLSSEFLLKLQPYR
jgi:tetratricopeptide (TPR) repeat protein